MASSAPSNGNGIGGGGEGSSGNAINNARPSAEYKLKSSQGNMDNKYNVIILSGQNKLSEFTPPIRLIREQSMTEGFINDDDMSLSGAPFGSFNSNSNIASNSFSSSHPSNPIPSRKKKKSTFKIVSAESHSDNSSASDNEMEENNLWILEDYDGQNTSTGRMLDQRGKYVFFINEGDSFRVVPINKWYKFTSRPTFKPLSIEEAEKLMTSRNKDRWIMSKINKSNAVDMNLGKEGFFEEDLDYREVFDDDEGENEVEGDGETRNTNPANPNSNTFQKRKLSKIGKEMKKIVRNESSSGSESDPYKQSDEEETEREREKAKEREREGLLKQTEMENNQKKKLDTMNSTGISRNPVNVNMNATINQNVTGSKHSIPSSFPLNHLSGEENVKDSVNVTCNTEIIGNDPSVDKRTINMADRTNASNPAINSRSPSPSPSNVSILSTGTTSTLHSVSSVSSMPFPILLESDIIQLLKVTPMRTKDLLQKLKNKLKDAQNKNLFREYIKKLANLIGDPEGGEDKLLELKSEYR